MKKAAFLSLFISTLFLSSPLGLSRAQEDSSHFSDVRRQREWIKKELHAGRPRATLPAAGLRAASVESQPIDVKNYRLQIRLTLVPPAISGTVTMLAEPKAPIDRITIDAADNLTIDAVRLNDQPHDFQRKRDRVVIDISPMTPAVRQDLRVAIDYHGLPVVSGSLGGGMLVAQHGPRNTTVMATLSEPFAAPTWWPCVDDPTDKATAQIEATVPRGFQVASNGVLDRVESNADGAALTYFWREPSPIATYLVSVAATDYEKFEDTYTALDGTAMPLVYFVYPEHLTQAQQKFAAARRAMEVFAHLFGEYPFLGEKYGMAEFPWRGAMEHQTMTSLGTSIVSSTGGTQYVIAHELAHHWWGDLVTMRSWNDIWLNEGFATYAEALYYERAEGGKAGEYMADADDGKVGGRMGGTVYAEDGDAPFDDTPAIYDKGGWVLHMLRHVLGDEAFFAALKDYAARFAFSNASTADFQSVCEGHYGKSLDWFFRQWVYAPNRPFYKVSMEVGERDAAGNYPVTVTIRQKQSQEIPGRAESVYIMPLDLKFHYADGDVDATARTVWNDSRKQTYTFTLAERPERVAVDEDGWVLKKIK